MADTHFSAPLGNRLTRLSTLDDDTFMVKPLQTRQRWLVATLVLSSAGPAYAGTGGEGLVPLPPPRPAALTLPAAAPAGAPETVCTTSSISPEEAVALVRQIAEEESVDPRLAEAVAKVESDHGRHLVSEKGAVGVMQLSVETAKDYGVSDRCDPKQNIRAGIQYLRDLLGTYDNNAILALAAFNAGPRRVYDHRGVPVWNETSKYIVSVLNHWQDYASDLSQRRLKRSGSANRPSGLSYAPVVLKPLSAADDWIGGQVLDLSAQ